jgi:hypothetical protein
MMAGKPREGFHCKTCKKYHYFPPYVFAHWRELLTHTCDNCGAMHEICAGASDLIKEGKLPEATP